MALSQHSLDVTYHQGKERGLSGAPYTENPHRLSEYGTDKRALAMSWLDGWQAGLAIRQAQS